MKINTFLCHMNGVKRTQPKMSETYGLHKMLNGQCLEQKEVFVFRDITIFDK